MYNARKWLKRQKQGMLNREEAAERDGEQILSPSCPQGDHFR